MNLAAGRLPGEVSGLVGRRAETADVEALLSVARLVTITGPGGVGKTRVCLRTAANAKAQYADGICFLELSSLRDPGLLVPAVARGLGLHVNEESSPIEAVLAHLRDRNLLLVLDTCEHLAQACALLAEEVLRRTLGVTLLATSRQPLDVAGEHVYQLRPLPVPELTEPDAARETRRSRETAGAGDAVELFAARAAAAVPGFRVTSENLRQVIGLCQRLDGMPLAIELAATALRALPLSELTACLPARGEVLAARRRGRDPRHRSLDAAIEWSYDLCSPAGQALWRRLSVFAGAFGISAAEEVCAGDEPGAGDVLQELIGLVDQSVVSRDEADGTRYLLLDTIREFGLGKLKQARESAEFRGRHLARYLRMARYFGDHFLDDDQVQRYRELRAEHDEITAALEYGLGGETGRGQLENDAAELATALYGYWQIFSPKEGKYWLGKVLDRFGAPSPQRARALAARAYLSALQAVSDDAIADARESIEIAEQSGDDRTAARGYLYLMLAQIMDGALAEAADSGAEAGRRLEALGDRTGMLILDAHRATLAQFSFDIDGAIRHTEAGLRRFGDNSKELWLHGYLLNVAAMGHFLRPDGDADSTAATTGALRAKYELGDTPGIALCLEGLACLASRAGRYERVGWLHGAADALWERSGGRLASAAILEDLHRQAADPVRAALGQDRYDGLRAAGSAADLDIVVSQAVADDDHLLGAAGPDDAGPAMDDTAPPPGSGPESLTGREREIAALAASGLTSPQIADQLVISRRTVEAHLAHVYAKLDINSRVELVRFMPVLAGEPAP